MNRVLLLSLAFLFVAMEAGVAQRVPATLVSPSATSDPATLRVAVAPPPASRSASVATGVVVGAILGGTIGVVHSKRRIDRDCADDGCFAIPPYAIYYVGGGLLGGAVVGGLVGALIAETRKVSSRPNVELKLTALASDAAGSLRSPAALFMVRRGLTPAR